MIGAAVELCSGIGGIGLGLRSLDLEVAKAYDSWKEAVAVYNHNVPGEVAVTCNLMSGKGRSRVVDDKKVIGDVDLLAAGPPCKGFSQLRNGHHDGRNGHNRVLAAMPDYVGILRPRVFLIENVPALITHRGGKTLLAVKKALERPATGLRYRVTHQVYDAAAYGTPQARRRVLILGVRNGSGSERLPEPGPDLAPLFTAIRHGTALPADLEDYRRALADPSDDTLTTATQALSDLPALGAGQLEKLRPYACSASTAYQKWVRKGAPVLLSNTQTPAVNEETIQRLKHIPSGGCARSIPDEHLNGLARRFDSAYRRLHPDAPSTALSTKYDCVYHYARPRSLSVREYARLQGIPDRVSFPADLACRRSAYEMIGNSVPPLLIERVLRQVFSAERAEQCAPVR